MQFKAENIKKIVGGNVIFDNLTMEVHAGEHVALVGRKGSWKTILFKLLANIEQPDEGRVVKAKGSSIGYLAQQFDTFNPKMRLIDVFRENVSMTEGDARHVLASYYFSKKYSIFKKMFYGWERFEYGDYNDESESDVEGKC